AYNNLGAAYYLAGNLSAAAEAWDRSLAIKPTRSAYSNTGTMYFYLGDYETAAERFIQAADFAPRDHRPWGNLADAFYFTDSKRHVATVIYKQAIEFAEERIQVNPLDMETIAMSAHYFARSGNDEKARQRIATAQAGAPEDIYVQYYSALVAAQLGDTDDALAHIERAIALDYKKELLRVDPGLSSLSGLKEFRQLVAEDGR
ncbi:MAG: tetratricopeptide repeat protein, partial [Woeseiaceae bacterium]